MCIFEKILIFWVFPHKTPPTRLLNTHVIVRMRTAAACRRHELRVAVWRRRISNTTTACVLAEHPGVTSRLSSARHFKTIQIELPSLEDGQIELETLHLSVDPYMRCRFDPGHPQLGEYLTPFELNRPPTGGGIGRVVVSRHPDWSVDDVACLPFSDYPWQKRVRMSGTAKTTDPSLSQLRKLRYDDRSVDDLSLALGALGMPGLTSYFGVLAAADPEPGETLVISGAAGACGTIAGQIAKQRGARVVGIAGTAEKCAYLTSRLGFDRAVDYKDPNFEEALSLACPNGVDCYFDNVGGSVSDAVLALVNRGARVPVCGQIARYHDDVPYEDLTSDASLEPSIRALLRERDVRRFRYLVLDHAQDFEAALVDLEAWIRDGSIEAAETITRGFYPADALVGMLSGGNIGKAVVKIQKA